MKTLITKSKSSLILALAIIAGPTWSKSVAQITELKGNVFLVSETGATKAVKLNDHIDDRAELLVGEDGAVTLNNYFNVTYHLTHSSHMKFYEKSVQLKKGKAWIQSFSSRQPLALTTANGHVDFWKSEFIATFDQITAKTQILAVSGELDVANVLENHFKHTLTAGTFTVIDPEVENGQPRAPTKVGLTSLNQALAEFKALPDELKKEMPLNEVKREIASVETGPATSKKGEIIFIGHNHKVGRLPASVNTVKKTKNHELGHASINYYGISHVEESVRNPASIHKVSSEITIDPGFEENLRIDKESSPKYSKELESLIEDLQSY